MRGERLGRNILSPSISTDDKMYGKRHRQRQKQDVTGCTESAVKSALVRTAAARSAGRPAASRAAQAAAACARQPARVLPAQRLFSMLVSRSGRLTGSEPGPRLSSPESARAMSQVFLVQHEVSLSLT